MIIVILYLKICHGQFYAKPTCMTGVNGMLHWHAGLHMKFSFFFLIGQLECYYEIAHGKYSHAIGAVTRATLRTANENPTHPALEC
jgi:hypothetical protein